MEVVDRIWTRFQDWLGKKAGYTKCPDLDDRVRCPDPGCSKRMLYRDVFEHFFATHIFPEYPYQVDRKPEETTGNMSSGDDFSVSDYVDDYEIDRDQEEGQEIELQEPTGGHTAKRDRLRKRWKPYLRELKSEGQVRIGPREKPLGKHGPRGSDAARKLKSAIKRLDVSFQVRVEHRSQGAIIKVKR